MPDSKEWAQVSPTSSWHIVAGLSARTDRPGWLRMWCGRLAPPDTVPEPDRPEGRTCESCYRNEGRAA